MSSRVANITVDARDPIAQARWWAQVLEDFGVVDEGAMNSEEAELRGPGGRWLEFIRVPEPKRAKNRLHLCLRAVGTTRDSEVERILSLGASIVDDRRVTIDAGWVVLADPEGNEFCVLATPADEAGVTGP